jgi:hypothetical protein
MLLQSLWLCVAPRNLTHPLQLKMTPQLICNFKHLLFVGMFDKKQRSLTSHMFDAVDALANSIDAEIDAIDHDRDTEYRLHHNRAESSASATPPRGHGVAVRSSISTSATRDRAAAIVQSSQVTVNSTSRFDSYMQHTSTSGNGRNYQPLRSSSYGSTSPPPRNHIGVRDVAEQSTSTILQRERVESILRGFSSRALSASQQQSQHDEGKKRRQDSTLSISASANHNPTSSFASPYFASHRKDADAAPAVTIPRGTIDQALIVESQNEVVSLRDALLKTTEALHRTQTELRNEQYRCTQFLDDVARQQREGEANRLEISQLKFDLDASRRSEQRNNETQQETIHHLNRLVEQQTKQIRELMLSQESWQRKCDVKDDDIAKVLNALQRSGVEQQELRDCLAAAEKEQQRLLRFVDGPLASFARDAETLRSTWNNLEVNHAGDISAAHHKPRTLFEHRIHQRSKKGGERMPTPSPGRKLIERLITQHSLEKEAADIVARVTGKPNVEYVSILRRDTSSSFQPSASTLSPSMSASTTSSSASGDAATLRPLDDSLWDDDL